MKKEILLKRHYTLEDNLLEDKMKRAYYSAYLLTHLGVEITNPERLTKEVVKQISSYFKLSVPKSFYENPQNTKYYSADELLTEQLVSYLVIAIEGTHNDSTQFDRIEIFKKVIPEYTEGDDIKTRKFTIVNSEEAKEILKSVEKSYCEYTRPFGIEEREEFLYLYKNGFYDGTTLKCKDNIFDLVKHDINFARGLDRKDIVKYSFEKLGKVNFEKLDDYKEEQLKLIAKMIPLAYETPMSKKQAKMFNKICKECEIKLERPETNERSPYRLARIEFEKGNILGASAILAKNGSLLERNLKMLLSRANPREAVQIIDMLPDKNPVALYQLIETITKDNGEGRVFTFKKNNMTKKHIETEYETKWRKSTLNESTREMLKSEVLNKIERYYLGLEKLGKIYISPEFEKITLPTNTSASGKGLDVLPTGSRTEIKGDYIRTFCYWNNVFDIDASAIFLKEDFKETRRSAILYWGSYALKPFGNSALYSGDCRAKDGAEYQDFKLSEISDLGYKYVIYTVNGFGGKMDVGDIACGYQDKTKLETKAWDPKNIEFKINIKGNREYTGFVIDVENREIITINLNVAGNSLVVNPKQFTMIEKYLDKGYLETMNMAKIIACRGEVVTDPKDADVIFDSKYQPLEGQKVVRPYETEKLVELVNAKPTK